MSSISKIGLLTAKYGVAPDDTHILYRHVKEKCPHLEVKGLMTIGKEGDLKAFETLRNTKQKIDEVEHTVLELSMGMSADF